MGRSDGAQVEFFGELPVKPKPGETDVAYPRLAEAAKARIRSQVPPLTWEDVLWLEVMMMMYGPAGINSLPKGKPLTGDITQHLTAQAIKIVVQTDPALARAAGAMQTFEQPGPVVLDRLMRGYFAWHTDVLERAMGQHDPADARLEKLSRTFHLLSLGLLSRHAAYEGGLAQSVQRRAKRRGIELGEVDSNQVYEKTLEIKNGAYFIGDDGQSHLNAHAVVDRMRSRSAPRVVQPLVGDDGYIHEPPAPEPDPSDAAETAEIARIVRDFRADCHARGRSTVAAFEYVSQELSREEVARQHGVTVEALRNAESWVTETLRIRLRNLTG